MGPAVIRGLKPTAKINCRYATDKLSSTGDTDGQNPLFDGNPNPRASAKCPPKQSAGRTPALPAPSRQRRLILAVGFNPRDRGIPHRPPSRQRRLNSAGVQPTGIRQVPAKSKRAGRTPALPAPSRQRRLILAVGFNPRIAASTRPRRVATVECHPNNTGDPPARFAFCRMIAGGRRHRAVLRVGRPRSQAFRSYCQSGRTAA